ncbi:MAG: type II toxin-antitoxin system HipA family toxin [Bacteroidales bacterium]|nr:type II toxin-antitoxin system HipA family toxin [Bacteroidales bacterium]
MINVANVVLYGQKIGTVLSDEDGLCRFEYAPEFVSKGIEPSPLLMRADEGVVYTFRSLSRETFHGLPGMLADSLPDSFGRDLLDRWLQENGRTQANAVETLCFQGRRCMGALEYEPARDLSLEESESIELTRLVETARLAMSGKESLDANLYEDRNRALMEIIKVGTSAGGQRAKAVIALNDTTGEIRSGQITAPEGFDYWLLKFDGFDSNGKPVQAGNFGRREYAFHKTVLDAGIDMTECRLIHENGRAHFMTKRFDRQNGRKIHMQTLCGLAHFDFRTPGAYSYEQALMVMRRLGLPYPQFTELFRRMVYNVFAVNRDDHTKNISFLMDENGKWRLSPAYDMGLSYNPLGAFTSLHQMSICGKREGITRADLLVFADKENISGAEQIIEQVESAVMNFPRYAAEVGVPTDEINAIMSVIDEKRPR